MPNWKTAESYQRLLAAMVASQDLKLNFKQIAKYYGEGTTYNSIEGRFRIIKEDAKKLKAEAGGGGTPNTTPVKKEKVLSGRVVKNSGTRKVAAVKIEDAEVLGMDGSAEIGEGDAIKRFKEEVISSGDRLGYDGEEAVAAWDAGFMGQSLI
ncbi:MAG: hypothetical protein Q9195_008926 [Heterodermia aff. obscurata]